MNQTNGKPMTPRQVFKAAGWHPNYVKERAEYNGIPVAEQLEDAKTEIVIMRMEERIDALTKRCIELREGMHEAEYLRQMVANAPKNPKEWPHGGKEDGPEALYRGYLGGVCWANAQYNLACFVEPHHHVTGEPLEDG